MKTVVLNRLRSSGLACAMLATGLASAAAVAQSATETSEGHTLVITIANVEHTEAPIMLEILPGEAGFAGKARSIASFRLPARAGAVSLSLDSLPPGDYAIRVMQDLDGNGDLNANLVGMPTEPWGMSNDALGHFGPPTWEDARFPIPGTGEQVITLR